MSSTFRDLVAERQKVLEAILQLRAFPSGMEMFPSVDEEQFEFIKHEIDSSDYYVVIVAGKYGSLAPDRLSYTEKEYDYAVEQKKYVIGLLVKDPDKLQVDQSETDSKQRKKLEAFRAKVCKGRLVSFYSNSDELKSQALQALRHAFDFAPRDGWVRATKGSRLEDAHEINRLLKRVMELEAENQRLKKTDPREQLTQGDDPITLDFSVGPLSTTWDNVFVGIFEQGPAANSQQAASWAARKLGFAPNVIPRYDEAVRLIETQFSGLGLITVDVHGTWRLTERGSTRRALRLGHRRETPLTDA